MPIGVKPTVDFAFKKIFGSLDNSLSLIGLLNAILQLPEPITEVEIVNPFSYQEFVGDKLVVLDVRARDSTGRWLNVEMQVTVTDGLLPRLTYYACSLFVDQLEAGGNYASLRPAISICLLNKTIFADSARPHHRFCLTEPESGRGLPVGIEVHTLELLKYNLQEASISFSSPIHQWAFFLLFADQYDAVELRGLLPAVEFHQAISVIETISAKSEDRLMYDQREKAQRDHQWAIAGAREEGREEGLVAGLTAGKIQLLQQLLNEPVTSAAELTSRDASSLDALLQELQERLRLRQRDD